MPQTIEERVATAVAQLQLLKNAAIREDKRLQAIRAAEQKAERHLVELASEVLGPPAKAHGERTYRDALMMVGTLDAARKERGDRAMGYYAPLPPPPPPTCHADGCAHDTYVGVDGDPRCAGCKYRPTVCVCGTQEYERKNYL